MYFLRTFPNLGQKLQKEFFVLYQLSYHAIILHIAEKQLVGPIGIEPMLRPYQSRFLPLKDGPFWHRIAEACSNALRTWPVFEPVTDIQCFCIYDVTILCQGGRRESNPRKTWFTAKFLNQRRTATVGNTGIEPVLLLS